MITNLEGEKKDEENKLHGRTNHRTTEKGRGAVQPGKTIGEAARQIGVTEQTYYRWRKQYGGMNSSDAKRLKELEKENARLKKLVADLSLDNAILKDVAEGKF